MTIDFDCDIHYIYNIKARLSYKLYKNQLPIPGFYGESAARAFTTRLGSTMKIAIIATVGVILALAGPVAAQDKPSLSERAGGAVGGTVGATAAAAAGGPVAGALGSVVGQTVGATTGKVARKVMPWNWGKKKKPPEEPRQAQAAGDQGASASAQVAAEPALVSDVAPLQVPPVSNAQ